METEIKVIPKTICVSPQLLRQYHAKAALPDNTLTTHYKFEDLVHSIRAAYQTMKQAKKDHRKNRITYVEGLAEAIVIHYSPHLDTNEAAHIKEERVQTKMKVY